MMTTQISDQSAQYLIEHCGVDAATLLGEPADAFYDAAQGGTEYFLFGDVIVEISPGQPDAWGNGSPDGPDWESIKAGNASVWTPQ